MHAAILAINKAVEVGIVAETMAALCNPSAVLVGLQESLGGPYQEELCRAKEEKAENAKNRVSTIRFVPPPISLSHTHTPTYPFSLLLWDVSPAHWGLADCRREAKPLLAIRGT